MNFREFHTALRVLATLNRQDLVDADAIDQGDAVAWDAFNADPLLWILRADERRAGALWQAMQRRASVLPLPPHTIDTDLTPADANIVQLSPRRIRSRF